MDATARWFDQGYGLHLYTGTETPQAAHGQSGMQKNRSSSNPHPAKSTQSRPTSLRELFSSSSHDHQRAPQGIFASIKAVSQDIFHGQQEPAGINGSPVSPHAGGIADSFKDFAKGADAANNA